MWYRPKLINLSGTKEMKKGNYRNYNKYRYYIKEYKSKKKTKE